MSEKSSSRKNEFLPLAQGPLDAAPAKISAKGTYAGGAPAVINAMLHAIPEAGVLRSTSTLMALNQMKGFDCPGCAWPDPDEHRSMAEFCENGTKAIAEEATTERMTPEKFAQQSLHDLSLLSDFEIGKSGRLTHPMLRDKGGAHYRPISWEEAFTIVAQELNALATPDEAAFYTSGRTSNEAAFLYQLFVRIFGTNNLPDCSNMCHESSGVALNEAIGIGKGTVKLSDFYYADCILVVGQNPGTNHPRMLSALQRAARNGCKIISINPLEESGLMRFKHPQEVSGWLGRGTQLATSHLSVQINGDVALFKGIMKEMLELEEGAPGTVFNHEFIRQHTVGFDAVIATVRAANWDEIVEGSGVPREQIRDVAAIIAQSKRVIACYAMGLTQHKNAVGNIQELVNILLLGGHMGRPGAGICPVRGHSNVQGDRTMGVGEAMPQWFLDALGKEFNFTAPRDHGLHVVTAIQAMHAREVKVFFAMGGNFLSASPDTEFVGEALRRTRLTVHVSTKLNRSHLITGERAIILPCLGRTEIDHQASGEQFVTVENSMGVVSSSNGRLAPASEHLKSEIAVVCELAAAVFRDQPAKRDLVRWSELVKDYGLIRDHISRVVPGTDNYNEKVQNPAGFYLPNPPRDRLEFHTKSGKAQFSPHQLPTRRVSPGRFTLMTIRSHDQFNTTIYGLDDRYRGIKHGRRVLLMNVDDMTKQGFVAQTEVTITSHVNGAERVAYGFRIVPYEIPQGCLASYFPEANVLVPIESFADRSFTPIYKAIEVSLKKSSA